MASYTTAFNVNVLDLQYILKQIKIAEDTSIGYTPLSAPKTIVQSIMDAYGVTAANAAQLPAGLRTVDGTFNNLIPGQSEFGAADTLFPRLTDPVFRNNATGTIDFDGTGPAPAISQGNYGVLPDASPAPGLQPGVGTVVDSAPRTISNLIVDMSINNPAAVDAWFNNPLSLEAFEAANPGITPLRPGETPELGVSQVITNEDLKTIPNQSPDIGLSPGFNSWMTFFGQFFDHGLDLVTKGSNGTVYIPLNPDDPLYVEGSNTNFMALTRATATIDANGVPQHENTTTSWIDQNQTYTSHASHQVFLREYVRVDGHTVATGKLLDGAVAGTLSNWAEVKAQALEKLGIVLTDFDVHNVPLLLVDQYGKFIPGANGYAQVATSTGFVEGTATGLVLPANTERTNHAFLNDIAHHATPGRWDSNGDGRVTTADAFQTADADPGVGDDGDASTYDNEMLDAHFITGDGRGNENIALTSVHSIFHSEHNRLVDANKATLIENATTPAGLAFLNEWLVNDVTSLPADLSTLVWDGERLFQAARFSTEMQYQHLVFEEFARRIQPNVDPFIFNSVTEIDPSIVAEFAHTVYRFGHSMLTGTVDRLDNSLNPLDPLDQNAVDGQQSLLAMFLNPQAYLGSGASAAEINANLIRGLSRDVGNEIDEFIVSDVRSSLLGLPLDLAALNIARGRETGIPSLNETRAQLYNAGAIDLKPYTSWVDFSEHLKNPASIVNFVAAYGTHASILAETTTAGMRDAAVLLVTQYMNNDNSNGAVDFLEATGAYAGGNLGGLNNVDLWIGGLAEAKNEFGGMLGQTFNFIFEYQMESLQFGDRLYYLTRTQGTNFLNQLEPNTFSDLVMRNTDLGGIYSTHLNGALFVTPDHIFEMDTGIAQEDYNVGAGIDPTWAAGEPHSALQTKVTRTVSGVQVLDSATGIMHDVGGTFKFLGGEHVVVGGTEGNDKIWTDKGIDTIWGDGGNDYINAGMESDDVFGGEGDDIIEDPFGDDVLRGNQGNDVIASARGIDLLFGDEGNDFIMLGQDDSEIFGGEGDDFILGGGGKDFLLGNEGNDWIEGGAGFDTIAGDNSELFFNSPVIGHDVLFNQGDEGDYDAESGDDIMGSGPSVFRYEGMFGFDWAIAKNDITGVSFDMQIPVFTTIPNDILKDRFDQVEALSGWTYDDFLQGDDRGHKGGGSSAPDSVPTELFADHILTAEGIDRITGFRDWFDGGLVTLFGSVPGANINNYRDGNILMGGDGNDAIRGRGGYDIIDGDAWLNVRIKIVHNGVTYSAESLSSDTSVMGQFAGKVYNVDANGDANFSSPAFGGVSLTSLMLTGVINPGSLSIVREIKYDTTPSNNIDTAFFQGTYAEYDIEGRGAIVDLNNDGDTNDIGEGVQAAFDLNGDGFISVRDRDTGAVGATVNGVTLSSRGNLTDDLDLLKNIEQLQFADQIIQIAGPNNKATGTVTILDPTPFDHDDNALTPPEVSPYVGQLLSVVSQLYDADNDANGDGDLLDAGDTAITNVTYEWQTTEVGNNAGWSTITTDANPYTVRSVDPGHVLRAVATFTDKNGITERVYSASTGNPTAALSVNEEAPTNTVVMASIPFSVDYDSLTGVDVDITTLHHQIRNTPAGTAGGRFDVIQNGVDALGNPVYQVVVGANGGAALDYETQDAFQIVDNQYQIVIDSYSDTIANGGLLLATRQFTVLLNDVANEGAPSDIIWNGATPGNSSLPPTDGAVLANLATVDSNQAAGHVYTLEAGSSTGFAVSVAGVVTATAQMDRDSTYTLVVKSTDSTGASKTEQFTVRSGRNGVANVITGTAADDITYGLSGNDNLGGGAGDDNLFGQAGIDSLDGGIGNDRLSGGAGNDTLNGGIGIDTAVFASALNSGGTSFALNGAGNLVVTADGTDTLTSIEKVQFTDGTYNVNAGTNAGDTLLATVAPELFLGFGGTDTVSYANAATGVTVNLSTNTSSTGDRYNSIDNVTGSALGDSLTGNGGNNVLTGGGGNDTLNGNGGTDTAAFSGALANYGFALSGANLVVTDNRGGSPDGTDTLSNIDILRFGAQNLELNQGSNGVNNIDAGGGNDLVLAFDGNDNIIGGAGADVMFGGNGNDTYIYSANQTGTGANRDVIMDFGGVVLTNDDFINLSAIDANTSQGSFGNQAFTFIGTAAFSDSNAGNTLAAGQIRYQLIDTNGDLVNDSTLVQGNVDNNLAADFEILLQGVTTGVTAGDFSL